MISFQTQPDRRRLTAALRRAHRRILRLLWVCPFLTLFVALLNVLDRDPVGVAVWVVASLVLALLPSLTLRLLVQAHWKLYGIPITWTFTEDGIHSANTLTEGSLRWAAVTRVDPVPGQLLFRLGWTQAFPVPVDGLGSRERDELIAFLRARKLLTGEPAPVPQAGR